MLPKHNNITGLFIQLIRSSISGMSTSRSPLLITLIYSYTDFIFCAGLGDQDVMRMFCYFCHKIFVVEEYSGSFLPQLISMTH